MMLVQFVLLKDEEGQCSNLGTTRLYFESDILGLTVVYTTYIECVEFGGLQLVLDYLQNSIFVEIVALRC